MIKDKSTDLCGNFLLEKDFIDTLCEMKMSGARQFLDACPTSSTPALPARAAEARHHLHGQMASFKHKLAHPSEDSCIPTEETVYINTYKYIYSMYTLLCMYDLAQRAARGEAVQGRMPHF